MSDEFDISIEENNEYVDPGQLNVPGRPEQAQVVEGAEHIVIELSELPEPDAHLVVEMADLPPEPATPSVATETLVVEMEVINCSFCSTAIAPGEPAGRCKHCQTPYHEACWKENHGCGVLNCSGKNSIRQFERTDI